MSSKLVDIQEELDKTSQELEQEKAAKSARVDEIEALKQVTLRYIQLARCLKKGVLLDAIYSHS